MADPQSNDGPFLTVTIGTAALLKSAILVL